MFGELEFNLAQYSYLDTQIYAAVNIKDMLRMIPASDLFFINNYKSEIPTEYQGECEYLFDGYYSNYGI